jgi:hypothetical protein
MSRDFDSPWKETLETFLPLILLKLFPQIHARIDWSVPPVSLDAELQQIVREGELGPQRVDKLFRVKLLDGKTLFLLIHIEVQSQVDPNFELRMFCYAYRIFDRYEQHVESLAILADESPNWRPSHYEHTLISTKTRFEFSTAKLYDWRNRLEELENDENPVSLLILAHLQSQLTHEKIEERSTVKFRLIRGLLERGFEAERARKFLRLIDWFLDLPADRDRALRIELQKWEKEKQMPYIPSYEREAFAAGELKGKSEGIVEGKADGKKEGKAETLLEGVRVRFGKKGVRFANQLAKRKDTDWVEPLGQAIWIATSLDELKEAVG